MYTFYDIKIWKTILSIGIRYLLQAMALFQFVHFVALRLRYQLVIKHRYRSRSN